MDLTSSNDEMSVGIKILDCDHREMTEAIYEIQAVVSADLDPGRSASLLRKLAGFSMTHFALEEGMMAATRYPGLARHRLEHHRIAEQLRAFASLHRRSDLTLDHNSLRFLAEMHAAHIQQGDLRYGLWLNKARKG
jgi:hemerythrin